MNAFSGAATAESPDYIIPARVVFLSSFPIALYVVFLLLKVAKVIDWSWGYVHAPMWIQVIFYLFIFTSVHPWLSWSINSIRSLYLQFVIHKKQLNFQGIKRGMHPINAFDWVSWFQVCFLEYLEVRYLERFM